MVLVFVASMGCTRSPEPSIGPTTATRPATGIVIRDRLGRDVVFAEPPQRIISLWPATTELMFAIGAGAQLVGATDHCDYPAAAKQLPRVGAGTLESVSRETIIGLEPDLVLCKWDYQEPLVDTLERLDIPVLAVGADQLAELYDEAILLGRVCDHETESQAMVAKMKRDVDVLTQLVAKIPEPNRPSVFYEVWDEPLMTAGPSTFIGEMLRLAGLKNIIHDTTASYPNVSSEVVVARDPELILAPSSHASAVVLQKLRTRQGWGEISAIRNDRLHLISGDCISRCGPRLVIALEEIIDAAYGPDSTGRIGEPTTLEDEKP